MPSATRLAAPEGPGPVPGVRLLTLPTSAIRAHGVALSAAAVLALCALGRAGAGETADVLLRGQWPPPRTDDGSRPWLCAGGPGGADRRGAHDVDVVSVNHYHRWSPEPGRLSDWVKWSGRPFPDSEWHAMEFDRADIEVEGAGFRVRAQRDRGLFCQDTAIGPLRQPGCVGRHWFRYGGDSDARSAGLVDRQYRPHTEMTEVMQAIDGQVCPLAEFLSTTPDG